MTKVFDNIEEIDNNDSMSNTNTGANVAKHVIYRTISFDDLKSAGYQITLKSESDTLKIETVRKDNNKTSISDLFKALKFLGLRINEHLTFYEQCEHRTLSGKLVTNYRVVGEERGDRKWIESGYASDDAKSNTSGMKDMVQHLNNMGRGM